MTSNMQPFIPLCRIRGEWETLTKALKHEFNPSYVKNDIKIRIVQCIIENKIYKNWTHIIE